MNPEFIHTDCPLCGLDAAMTIHREHTRYFETPVSFTIVSCTNCGMVYTNPRLQEVNLAYEERQEVNWESLQHYMAIKQPVFSRALQRITKLRPPPDLLLDVGCGAGDFLTMAVRHGYRVMGVEPSPVDVRFVREQFGYPVVEGIFEEVAIEQRSIGIVTMWDVIEHVAQPRTVVRRAFAVLRAGGVLAMRMPGADFHRLKAGVAHLLHLKASIYSPVIHLSFFSPQTITRLLKEEGFEEVKIFVTTAEKHSQTFSANLLRSTWGRTAAAVAGLCGVFLDNLEVYARK